MSGCFVAALWRRGIHYSNRATFASIGLAALVCVGSGAAVLCRDATDPYGLQAPNDRSDLVVLALRRHDCARRSRRALAATQKAVGPTPEVAGLRAQVDRECPAAAQ